MKKKRTSVYLTPQINVALENAPNINGRLSQICDRYAESNRRARIQAKFTEPELNAIRECCKDVVFSPASMIDGAILARFKNSIDDEIYAFYGLEYVCQLIYNLTYSEQVALVEDIEAFWRNSGTL